MFDIIRTISLIFNKINSLLVYCVMSRLLIVISINRGIHIVVILGWQLSDCGFCHLVVSIKSEIT